ncbi:MAG: LPS export ABC transporter permease LptG [Gammaproteobacteria bacterium]|nr:LPS export ABC transporter permease LptG [Gammaproteobacteria bacterium]
MKTLDRYVTGYFVKALLLVSVMLLALFSFVSLVDELDNVGQGSFTMQDAIAIVALTMPKRILDLLPTIALLGTVIGLGSMAGNREIVILRALGWSPWRIGRPVLLLVALLAVLVPVTQHLIIPPLERQAGELRAHSLSDSFVSASSSEFWTRSGQFLVRVGAATMGVAPEDIEIYQIDETGNVSQVTRAAQADILEDNRWLLHDVRISQLREDEVKDSAIESLEWESFLSEKQMSAFLVPAQTLSLIDLSRYIKRLTTSGLSTLRFRLIFWQQAAIPLSLIAMTIVGLPFVMGSTRSFSAGSRIAVGATIGIVFYLLQQVAGHVTLIAELNPVLTSLLPSFILLIIGLTSMRKVAPPNPLRGAVTTQTAPSS